MGRDPMTLAEHHAVRIVRAYGDPRFGDEGRWVPQETILNRTGSDPIELKTLKALRRRKLIERRTMGRFSSRWGKLPKLPWLVTYQWRVVQKGQGR